MRRTILIPSIVAALSVVGLAAGSGQAASRQDQVDCAVRTRSERVLDVVGLTADGRLVCFETTQARGADLIGRIRGLQTDTKLVGIDYRPATGALYGLGDSGGLYVLNPRTAEAHLRARLDVTLQGTRFGIDFNPTVDRLRIVSDTGQNLRTNVDDGTTTTDTALNYLGPPPVSPALGVTARRRHQQRRQPEHGDDAVRRRQHARPGRDPGSAQRRHAQRHRQADRRCRQRRRLRHLQHGRVQRLDGAQPGVRLVRRHLLPDQRADRAGLGSGHVRGSGGRHRDPARSVTSIPGSLD